MSKLNKWRPHLSKMLEAGRSLDYIKSRVVKWRIDEGERKQILEYIDNGKLKDLLGNETKKEDVKIMSNNTNNTSDIKEAIRQCLEEGKCDLLNELSKIRNDVDARIQELASSLDKKVNVMAKFFIRDKVKSINKPAESKNELGKVFNKVAEQKDVSEPNLKPTDVTRDDIKEAVRMCLEEGKCELLNEINKVKEELNSKIESLVKSEKESKDESERKSLKALPIEEAMKDEKILNSILEAINKNEDIKDKLLSTLGIQREESKEEEPKNPIYKLVVRRR